MMNNNLKPLSRKEMNELRKRLPKLEKRRKTIKDYINALKNYSLDKKHKLIILYSFLK